PPLPVSTATRASSSASKSCRAAARASAVGRSTALRTCGRSMMTVVTGPLRSTRTLMGILQAKKKAGIAAGFNLTPGAGGLQPAGRIPRGAGGSARVLLQIGHHLAQGGDVVVRVHRAFEITDLLPAIGHVFRAEASL